MAELTPRERFIKVYSNLPLPIRDEIIYIDESQRPVSWNVSYLEIRNNTELGKKILEYLENLNLI